VGDWSPPDRFDPARLANGIHFDRSRVPALDALGSGDRHEDENLGDIRSGITGASVAKPCAPIGRGRAVNGTPTQAAAKPFRLRLSHSLSALVAGEPNWWSESLRPGDWDPFHGALDPSTPLTAESFRGCAGLAASRAISSRPFDDYLDYVLGPANLGDPSVSTWRAFQQIAELLLSDRVIFSVGENETVDVQTFLVGRTADGSVVGIHAVTVET
jgi:hypothetical protein